MEQSVVYALDFDGVICNSALETGMSGWKAACQIWDDMQPEDAPAEINRQFREVRHVMGTGYEAILLIRQLFVGESVKSLLKSYVSRKHLLIEETELGIEGLKKIFGDTRDQWIEDDLEDWVSKNPVFPGVVEKLQRLSQQNDWYIVTTKQERFVKQILKANQIQLPDERIFGLDRNKPKVDILIDLEKIHADQPMYFIEDMLVALEKVADHGQLNHINLSLVDWGYNSKQDQLRARSIDIPVINMNRFLVEY